MKSRKKGMGKREAILLIAVVIIILTTVIIIVGKNKNVEDKNVGTTNNSVTENTTSNYEESEDGIKTNISNKVKEIKSVGDFKIEETKIIYANGVSTITAKLINNGEEKELVKLKIKLITTDGKVLKEIETQTGNVKQNGEKYIKASITEDIVDVSNVEYEIID